jgi:hypothetical protein
VYISRQTSFQGILFKILPFFQSILHATSMQFSSQLLSTYCEKHLEVKDKQGENNRGSVDFAWLFPEMERRPTEDG